MERSSPLAAMQPPSHSFGNWGFPADTSIRDNRYGGNLHLGPDSFNFKDLSMAKSSRDYFSLKPVRGSSPTASLAADLSQNFHIDRSPQLPTPRRALFATNLLGALNGRESMTTPPLPSSSPGPGNDSMDISPLPHKLPHVASKPIELQSPTPDVTPADLVLPSTTIVVESPADVPNQPAAAVEKKRPTLSRPLLSRTKGFSTNSVSFRSAAMESQLSSFKFTTGLSIPATSTAMSLEECFVSSPPQDRRLPLTNTFTTAMGPPKPRQPFAAMLGHGRGNGSPTTAHVRKPCAPLQRPRKQFRRSLSMFEHTADGSKQESSTLCSTEGLQSIMDVDDHYQLHLPHFFQEEESLPRICKETMIEILDGKYDGHYDQSLILDCRFEYEYDGGHIEGATNYNDKEKLSDKLFEASCSAKTLLIFHCEYSAHRAPIMAKFVRQRDRAMNAHQYPALTFPEIYILDGGYSSFFTAHRCRCFPQNYIAMAAKEYENDCERGLGRIKQQRAKLSRAKTFAFGQHDQPPEDSPTAPSYSSSDISMDLDVTLAQQQEIRRIHARRLASY